MWDVKVLIRTLYNVQLIVVLYIVLFVPAGLAIWRLARSLEHS